MSASVLYSQINYISKINEISHSKGINLEVLTDFEEFRETIKREPDLDHIYPMYDPACSFIAPTNGFWIRGTNEKGDVVHTQAVRLLDFHGLSLSEHLALHRRKYVIRGKMINPDKYLYSSSPASSIITGTVCYHGQLWLKGGETGFRGQGLSTLLPRLALALCLMEWSPDFVFCFASPTLACSGLFAQYGYLQVEPGMWHTSDKSESVEQWLAWTSRKDIEHIMKLPPTNLYQQVIER